MSRTFNRWKSPAWGFQSTADARYDLGIIGIGANGGEYIGPWTGAIFYVSNSGADTNVGTAEAPFLSITHALAQVTAGQNDVIVVLDYASLSRAAETFPIAITSDHNNVTIMGVPYGNLGSNAIYPVAATTAAFTITTANQVNLVNLNIGGYASGDYGVHFTGAAAAWRCTIDGCHFGTSGTTDWGIYISGDPPQLLVKNCDFHSGLTEGGIYCVNCTRGDFINNSFHVNSGDRGIQFSTSQADFGKILGNTFFVDDAAHGEAIYCSGALAGGIEMIAGNVAVPHGVSGGTQYTFTYEPYWWGGSGDPGVGLGPNIPDPVAQYLDLRPVPRGSLFFVDGTNGSDTYDGLTPAMAKATITAGMGLTTSGMDDCIIIMDYYLMTNEAAQPIPISKTDIHFIGKPTACGENTLPALVFPTGDTEAFEILNGANNISFHNLEIDAGANHAAIETDDDAPGGYVAAWRITVENCGFGILGALKHGIWIRGGHDLPYLTVKNCHFGQGLTDDAIQIDGNSTRGLIKDSYFGPLAAKGVDLTATVGMKLLRNYFACTDIDGGAIYMGAGCSDCFAAGNMAACGEDAAITNQLYYDGGSNRWVGNMTSDPTTLGSLYEVD